MDSWYALQVVTGREADVAGMLLRHGIQAIAPTVWRGERKDGHWTMVARRAIPGYVFVRCQMTTPLYYHLTRKPHVLQLLGQCGSLYTAIPDDQVHWIEVLHRVCGGALDQTSRGVAGADGAVEIMDGPLLALKDKIIKIDARRRRATVRISLYDTDYEIDMAFEPTDDKHSGDPAG